MSICLSTISSRLGSRPKCRRIWWRTGRQGAANEPYPLCEDSDERWVLTLLHRHTYKTQWVPSWLWSSVSPLLCSAPDCGELSLHCAAAAVWMKRSEWRWATHQSAVRRTSPSPQEVFCRNIFSLGHTECQHAGYLKASCIQHSNSN